MSGSVQAVEVVAKPWWQSKTVWLNVIGFAVIVGGIILDSAAQVGLPDKWAAWVGLGIAVGNAWLRFQTVVPVAASRGKRVELTGRPIDVRRE